jgi:hypothetical protein
MKIITSKFWTVTLLTLTLGLFAGCSYPSLVNENWGRSVENNKVAALLNPNAGQDAIPATGLSPQAAVVDMAGYELSFKRKDESKKEGQAVTVNLGAAK